MKRSLLPLLLIILTSVGYAQTGNSPITIGGKITALEDKLPVPHANISIDRKGVGTATNTTGAFALIIPEANLGDTLKISCIGFKTKYLPINKMIDKEQLNVVLERNITALKEIKLGHYDPIKIIQNAIARIRDNYIDEPHILRGFYRMFTYSDTDPLQLSEAVFDVYNFGYGNITADQFKLIKARSERNERDFSSIELSQKPNSIFENDVVNHKFASGFLNEEGFKKHTFSVIDIVDFQGFEVYEIEFEPIAGADGNTFNGRMFIDTKTSAFLFFDFALNPSGVSDQGLGNFIKYALVRTGEVGVELKKDHTQVTYQMVQDKWVLSKVESDHVLAIKTPGKDVITANIKFDYQVTAVDLKPKDSFNKKLDRNANINDHKSNADPRFWEDYNILLPDFSAEDIFKKIELINKLEKARNE